MGIINWNKTYRNDIGGTLFIEGRRRIIKLLKSDIINACYYDGVRWHQADIETMETLDELSSWLRNQEAHHHAMVR